LVEKREGNGVVRLSVFRTPCGLGRKANPAGRSLLRTAKETARLEHSGPLRTQAITVAALGEITGRNTGKSRTNPQAGVADAKSALFALSEASLILTI